ncbi:MAG: ABC transporter ATP-binding protein [Gammaproteobacteria bacterium]|nr:ABC transporter ATP-binding protein [Gammaproteobacteria bacterium]
MSAPLLTLHAVELRVATKVLCSNLDLQLHGGECWAILGSNGAGKTTLLHSLAGVRLADSGQIDFKQQPLHRWSRKTLSQDLALLPQTMDFPLGGRVMDYVLLGRYPHLAAFTWETETDIHIAQQALAWVDLLQSAERVVNSLSGGERQRLAIALILAQQTRILLLDEPVNHLDIRHQHQILHHLRASARQQNKLVVMALHDVNLAYRYCDHAVLMFQDGTTLQGEIQSLLNAANLSRLYGYPVELLDTTAGGVIVPRCSP